MHVECACVRGRVPGLGAFQTQLVPGLSLGIWGILEVPGLGAFHTQSRFISTQAGDAGWRSALAVCIQAPSSRSYHWRAGSVAMRVGVGSSCGHRVSCAGGVWVGGVLASRHSV